MKYVHVRFVLTVDGNFSWTLRVTAQLLDGGWCLGDGGAVVVEDGVSTIGIFEVEQKMCPGFTFRKLILIGRTDMGPKEVRAFMKKLAAEYSENTYNLITKNCNHFCNDTCVQLTGKPIPSWVN
ncbi:hypothetical protein LguiB_019383 [Lonicera macranthoides]